MTWANEPKFNAYEDLSQKSGSNEKGEQQQWRLGSWELDVKQAGVAIGKPV